MVQVALGSKPASDEASVRLIRIAADDWAYGIAGGYAFRAESDHAFERLERAYPLRDVNLPVFKCDPMLKNIRRDARYSALLRKMNLPE